ncbi:Phosphoenolpyruvate carboxykinase [ATP] [Planctomycetes bacterium Pan216]|uniref:Phosphoenolpyruvate carboxykinase (ATP) n=1 Tax=Kolteria novifilia TaxID=2527975 RepID=A0A518AYA0_9BACT|nr:Phosphoenolpyruvate carboxykinase [ATP] [Planctomycetes bacterium Pan216]
MLAKYGITVSDVLRNAPTGQLYELAVAREGSSITSTGAITTLSGEKTGRSPADKHIVENSESADDIWWGPVNHKLDKKSFQVNRQRTIDYFNTRDYLYVVDGFAGWDPRYRLKVRVICSMAYHALFMHNMLIRPTGEELAAFGEPDFTIFNAGAFPANLYTSGMTSHTSIDLNFEERQFVILGSMYAGEMKKGVFTVMNYLMPKRGVLSMHCSANEGRDGNVSLFFGLSGTGKTTLSADPRRALIGDDEHCWSDHGVFNIEGGCYAKCVDLSAEKEPQIFNAIRFGAVLENVVFDDQRRVDFHNVSVTENTRTSYPVEFIDNAKIPCVGGHPNNVIFLTCDAFGVLPPVSRLSPAQAMYHFMSGYTAKVAGTEVGITAPQATFSACFGAPFLVWHPSKYAGMLAERLEAHQAKAWLVNTGWTGGTHGVGARMKLEYTRAIIDAIHDGSLNEVEYQEDPTFGLEVPTTCPKVPARVLVPSKAWSDDASYQKTARHLAQLFVENFKKYEDLASEETKAAGPRV